MTLVLCALSPCVAPLRPGSGWTYIFEISNIDRLSLLFPSYFVTYFLRNQSSQSVNQSLPHSYQPTEHVCGPRVHTLGLK